MTRYGLLLTAVATVTVPAALAIMAVLGHGHTAARAGAEAAVAGGGPAFGPLPVAPPTARVGARDNIAAVQRAAGAPVTVLSKVAASQQARGMRLLGMAANAGVATSYQGTELISQSGVAGSVKTISKVWHKGGGATLVETPASVGPVASAVGVASGSPEGVFGVTRSLVALLGKHYVALYMGSGSAVGRPASIVGLYRFDGSLAAQYWLDSRAMVPLRRELFGTSGNVISEDSFVQVQFGALTLPRTGGAGTAPPRSPWPAQPAWAAVPSPARFLVTLTRQGWQVPATLPGGLPLYTAASVKTTSGEIVDLEYSDGLYVVSLFVQRGTLAPDMPGWRQVSVGGRQAFVSGHSVTWAGNGFVYTVIGDAPARTVTQVIGTLPRSGPQGLVGRLERGFLRIGRMINPFG